MGRPRTGSLELRSGIWHSRLTVTRKGKTGREWYSLDTADHDTAKRRLVKLLAEIAAGRGPTVAAAAAGAPETVAGYVDAIGKRLSDGDRENLRVHVVPAIGKLALDEVRPVNAKSIRDKVIAGGARRGTVGKVLGAVRRLFAAAVEDELVEHNPATDVKLPKQRGEDREIIKPRMILTDEEIARFLASEEADLELRMLSLVARCEGGMRTSDLHAWDWTHIEVETFASCTIPRTKTAKPERLDVPEVLRPFLRAWWERAGCPIAGPVFPVRLGPRAGERKARMNSYAERLRRDLFRAGVVRMPPVKVPIVKRGMRVDLGKRPEGTMPAPSPRDPLYFETPVSLPVDFHSFRRAFNSALAGAGVNVQKAMKLAGHSDAKTHMLYVMDTPEMRQIPDAALPRLGPVAIRGKTRRGAVKPRGSEGGDPGPDDGAPCDETRLFVTPDPTTKPGVACSNHAGRAPNPESPPIVLPRGMAEPEAPAVDFEAAPRLVDAPAGELAPALASASRAPLGGPAERPIEAPAPPAATVSASPRAVLLDQLLASVAALAAAGDLEAARLAHETAGKLLAAAPELPPVVDLDLERRRRGR